MVQNVGGLDRIVRLVVGPVLVIAAVAAFAGSLAPGTVAVVAGAILLVTGSTQRCPANEMAGIDTTTGYSVIRSKSSLLV